MSYANLKPNPDAERYVGTPCAECGKPVEPGYSFKRSAALCCTCDFWQCYVDGIHPSERDPVDPARVVRYQGRHYYIETEPGDKSAMRGYGGALFIVYFADGRVVETCNLWHQGTIPPRFRERLPDNTTRIEGMSV